MAKANAKKNQRVTIRGKAWYAKVLGEPVLNYQKDGKEWTIDVIINKDTVKTLKVYKLGNKLINRNTGEAKVVTNEDSEFHGEQLFRLTQRATRKDGQPNRPIPVVDITGKKWDQNKLIGNGSDIDVTFDIVDFGDVKGVYPRSIRVLKLVPYESAGVVVEELDEDDEFYEEYKAALKDSENQEQDDDDDDDEEDDDDIPF